VKVAVKGKEVSLNGEPGWVVDEAWSLTRTKDQVFVLGDSYRRQRDVSDI
jgi:hypothetical protein